jgi:hypothetical protein
MLRVSADEAFARAMGAASFNGAKAAPAKAQPAAKAQPPARMPRATEIVLGAGEIGGEIMLDLVKLMEGRALVQGISGAGKSWTLRRILEQTSAMVQQIVVDPEGEFRGLAERLGHLHVEGDKLDGAALATLGRRIREHRISVVLDLSDLTREDQMKAVAAFFYALIEVPREFWSPALVAVDEAHLFAPFGGQAAATTEIRRAAIGATTDLMSRGRKRGLAGILATQRLARLAKSVVSEVSNFLIGGNTLDLDVRRAAETIGWEARKAFDRLPMLQPGEFVAVGPAFSQSPGMLRVGQVETRHIGAAPTLSAPSAVDPVQARAVAGIDDLIAASSAGDNAQELAVQKGFRAVRAFMAEPAFCDAARIFGALAPVFPEGATLEALAQHLAIPAEAAAAGVALLDSYGAVEIKDGPDGEGLGVVRLSRWMGRR